MSEQSGSGVRVTLTLTVDVPLGLAVEGMRYVGVVVPLVSPRADGSTGPSFHCRVLDSTIEVPPGTAPAANDMTEAALAEAWQPGATPSPGP